MSVKPSLRLETERGTLTVPLIECDNCQTDVLEELAGGWIRLETIGPPLKLATNTPSGGYHFCSWPCLKSAVDTVTANFL